MRRFAPIVRDVDFTHVEIRELSRHFGRRRALHRVSFTCAAGQLIGLLGPNGAGKSTLISILATLATPTSGTVRYGELTASAAGPSIRARLGALGHDLYLYPELTARENLTFFARLHALPGAVALVEAALARAGLASRADDVVSGFSRGMRQRLALERALLHEPRLVLLDEPFTGLDDAATRGLLARLNQLRDGGAIVLLTTHDLDVVDGVLDLVVVLREGRLVACETPAGSLRQQYRAFATGGGRA
jgi:ABC-type multidrug transport system ATPase subunit